MGTINIQKSKSIDQVNTQERVTRLFSRSIKKESKMWALNTILSMIDLTTLEGRDSSGKVKQLCYKAAHLHDKHPGLPKVAAICVYPSMVSVAKQSLERTNIKTASVATGFPRGMTNIRSKIEEVKISIFAEAIALVVLASVTILAEVEEDTEAIVDAVEEDDLDEDMQINDESNLPSNSGNSSGSD